MTKYEFTTHFLRSLSYFQLEKIVDEYRKICIEKDRYYHYQGKKDWSINDIEPGQVFSLVVRNNDELSFNNNNYQVDNDVSISYLKNEKRYNPLLRYIAPFYRPSIDKMFSNIKTMIVNCEPAKYGNGMGHLRSSLLIGSHHIRSHAPGGNTRRQFIYHDRGWGQGLKVTRTLERTAICQRFDEPVPVLRTDGRGNILNGYSRDKTSWEVGRGFNFHDVSGNSSLGCITIPRVNGTDDRYMWNFRPILEKAKIKGRCILMLIGCDTLAEICIKMNMDLTNIKQNKL